MEYTKEPWILLDLRQHGKERITISGGTKNTVIARIENTVSKRPIDENDDANARRIVACVNACAGISTEYLERAQELEPKSAVEYVKMIDEIEQLLADIATLEQENRQMRARMERLEMELEDANDKLSIHGRKIGPFVEVDPDKL